MKQIKKNISINATGCSLVDTIINGVDFHSPAIKPFLSLRNGDGGLSSGELVFKENLEGFSDKTLEQILTEIDINNCFISRNIGGPAIVAMIAASQILHDKNVSFRFFQNCGNDENGEYIQDNLEKFAPAIKRENYLRIKGLTPETTVLSDPSYYKYSGERILINTVGTAGHFTSQELNDQFFEGDILFYGATALTPAIHKDLTALLIKGKVAGRINVVTTVFDFYNERLSPHERWPLGESVESYFHIDLLIVDYVEALRLSGKESIEEAIEQFKKWKLKALIVTNGSKPVFYYAEEDSALFKSKEISIQPVVILTFLKVKGHSILEGDTTGCGDNFSGGVISFIAEQLLDNRWKLDMQEAVFQGICAGASACFHLGGMYREKNQGDKLKIIQEIICSGVKSL